MAAGRHSSSYMYFESSKSHLGGLHVVVVTVSSDSPKIASHKFHYRLASSVQEGWSNRNEVMAIARPQAVHSQLSQRSSRWDGNDHFWGVQHRWTCPNLCDCPGPISRAMKHRDLKNRSFLCVIFESFVPTYYPPAHGPTMLQVPHSETAHQSPIDPIVCLFITPPKLVAFALTCDGDLAIPT